MTTQPNHQLISKGLKEVAADSHKSSPDSILLCLFVTSHWHTNGMMLQEPAWKEIEGVFSINTQGKVTRPVHTDGVQTCTHTKMNQARFNKKLYSPPHLFSP